VYVTLSRLERAGLVSAEDVEQAGHPDKRVYTVTPAGRERVSEWLLDVSWSKPAPVEFHLKLVAAGRTGLADPISLIDAQRLELLRRLRELQDLAAGEPSDSEGWLLLEGAALRLQADVRWLETCERWWVERESR
jgi:DNA-binding PadR family transcriptional regulator